MNERDCNAVLALNKEHIQEFRLLLTIGCITTQNLKICTRIYLIAIKYLKNSSRIHSCLS